MNFKSDNLNFSNLLKLVLDSDPECVVLVDSNANVVWLNKAYEKYLDVINIEVQGKPVIDVIPNTRLHIVVKSGIAEMGEMQSIHDRHAIVNRIPLFKEGKIIGAIGKIIFKTNKEFMQLVSKMSMLEKEIGYYKRELKEKHTARWRFEDIITCSPKINNLKKLAYKIAPVNVNVIVLGSSGSGKELFAHSIHAASKRSSMPFVCINCAAIPENIMESELFGYESGAFTSANNKGKIGKLEMANNGTVFLDEIGDMSTVMQAKLLRFLQEGELEKVGSTKRVSVDVRVICATNRDIKKMVEEGAFRSDLYYRLAGMVLEIPTLSERPEDIGILCNHFLKIIAEKWMLPLKKMDQKALEVLKKYFWPGNIRELQNLLERLYCMSEGDDIQVMDLPPYLFGDSFPKTPANNQPEPIISDKPVNIGGNITMNSVMDKREKEFLRETLLNVGGNKKKAAEVLGIHRTTLYYKLRKYGMLN